jgi:ABC-type transport system involved in cytochrome bd biosynthesis fused ATPase/permease subunit
MYTIMALHAQGSDIRYWFLARSPVYSHLSTTLQGLPTVRAFRRQHTAKDSFHNFQNEHTQVLCRCKIYLFTFNVVCPYLGLVSLPYNN